MRTLLAAALLLVACGTPTTPGECTRLNAVACIDGEFFHCVCDAAVCNPGSAGTWSDLGDSCSAFCNKP